MSLLDELHLPADQGASHAHPADLHGGCCLFKSDLCCSIAASNDYISHTSPSSAARGQREVAVKDSPGAAGVKVTV